MKPTDELYRKHKGIINAAAGATLGRGRAPHDRGLLAGEWDDLIQIGAEKWTQIVSEWDGGDCLQLRKLLSRACQNAMSNYLKRQGRRARMTVCEEVAHSMEDDAQELGVGRIDMKEVNELPPNARRLVMDTLGLREQPDGTVCGDGPPVRRTPVKGMKEWRVRQAKQAIEGII